MGSEVQPYVGPRPFKREDAPFFFGRDREADDLRSLIISHSEVLLYAQSGAGKTSLINTKLWTLLEDADLEVLPLARVQGPQPRSEIANIYVFNTLVKWSNNTATADELAGMTLRKFLESREQSLDKEGLPKPCVAIFDQFEELFTSHSECWQQRRGFFLQVRDALDALPQMRALFAMREDYIAAIDQYASIMPEKFRMRFHLENLREPQAIEAIKGPLTRGQKIRHFGNDVAETLARELMKVQVETASGRVEPITGEFVEPVQLQVVCQRLWRDLKPEDTEITLAHLETISVEKALLSFYEESIRDVARDTGINEATLRSWFEQKLVTPAGTRGMVFRGEKQTEGMPNNAVDALDELHLIRSEPRDGRRWYELTHDRFIDAIQKSRQKLLLSLQAGAEERRQKLEAKAADWASLGRKKSGLLRDVELLETQHWLDSPDAAALGSSETLLALVEASRADVQEHSARRRKVWLFVLGAVCFMTLLTAGYAFFQRAEARRQRQIADSHAVLTLARNLAARSAKYKRSDLGLALLLNLEANRIADEIKPETRLQGEVKASVLAEAKGGLLDALVSSPHLQTFFYGHKDRVRSVAFSPDGKILASGSLDGNVILWDLGGYPLGPPLAGHAGFIYSVAFSPDGKKVASCGEDGQIILWDVEKHEKVKSVQLDQGALDIVAFNPNDGNTLACGTQAGTVLLVDIERGQVSDTLLAHKGGVYGLAFSRDGKKFASSGQDKKIVFWDCSRLEREGDVEDNEEVFSVAFSPNGETLASGNRANEVAFWDVAKRERLGVPLKEHTDWVFSVAFSPDGATLVSGSTDRTIRRWDVAKRKQLGEPLTGSSKPVYSVAFNPDGKTVASGGGAVVLWDITEQSRLAQRFNLGSWIVAVAVAPDGKTLAASDDKGNITLVGENIENGYETFNAHNGFVPSLAFNSDGTTLASAGRDGSIQLRSWDGKTWNRSPKSLVKQTEPVWRIAFSPKDNRTLASADAKGVTLWDVLRGTKVDTLRPPEQPAEVTSVAFSPDGETLASGCKSGQIVLWNVATRHQRGSPLVGHYDAVLSVAFSPDGRLLASGSHDNAVILWDVVTRHSPDVFLEHTDSVVHVAFSPDGKMVASCSNDNSIILWDVEARELIGSLVTEEHYPFFSVAFSPDGELVSGGWGITNWDVRSDSLRASSDFIAARELTRDEWKHFLPERSYRPTSVYGRLKEADMLALKGELENARKAFDEVVRMSAKSGDAVLNNQIAWYGSLDHLANSILPACDRAVALAKNESKPGRCDTRGVARAMTGKIPEAIEDFQTYVTWLKTEEENQEKAAQQSSSQAEKARHQNVEASLKKIREKREHWIINLKSGRNPFDAATLMKLRRESTE